MLPDNAGVLVPVDNAHTHLSNRDVPAGGYVSLCAAKAEDWKQIAVKANSSGGKIIPSFGIHPWFMDEYSYTLLPALESFLLGFNQAGIGETGLDRTKKSRLSIIKQKELLKSQIDLAIKYNRVISLHCVRAWGHLFEVLHETNPKKILLHGWNGHRSIVETLVQSGAYFSLGPSSLQNQTTIETLPLIPMSRLLLETDESNISLEVLLQKLSLHMPEITPADLRVQIHQNFKTLFGV